MFGGGAARDTYIDPARDGTQFLASLFAGPVLVLSTTKEVSGYAGACLRVRRVSDSVEQDIGFVGKAFDNASLTSFIGGSTARLVTWYDQSGNANHAQQATTARQPQVLIDTDSKVSIKTTATSQGMEVADASSIKVTKPHLFMVRMRPQLDQNDSSILIAYTPTGTPWDVARWGLAWDSGQVSNGIIMTPRNATFAQHTYGTTAWSFDCSNFFCHDYKADTQDLKLQGGYRCSDPVSSANVTYTGTLKLMIGNNQAYSNGCNGEKFRAIVLYDTTSVGSNREAIKDYLVGSSAHNLPVSTASLLDYTDSDGFHWKTETFIAGYGTVDVDANGFNWKNEFGGFPWSFQKCTNVNNSKIMTQIEVRPTDTDMVVTGLQRAERVADVIDSVTSGGWAKGQTFELFSQFRWLSGSNITASWAYMFQHHTGAAGSPDNITWDIRNGTIATVISRDNNQGIVGSSVAYSLNTWYAMRAKCFWSTGGSLDTCEVWFGPNGGTLTKIVNLTTPQPLFYTTRPDANFKQGIYSGSPNQTIKMQFANHQASLTANAFSGFETTQPALPTHS